MRRFWAHILVSVTTLFILISTFTGVFLGANTNMEYKTGREIVFRLRDKETDTAPTEEEKADVEYLAGQMAERLEKSGVTSYKIVRSGFDTLKVSFSESNTVSRNNIVNYLSFNGIFGLSNMDDDKYYEQVTGEEFLDPNSKVSLNTVNGLPTLVIPVNVNNANFKTLLEQTKLQKENGIGEEVESESDEYESSDDTASEKEKEIKTYLYLWYDFDEDTDRYSRTDEKSDDYDPNIAKKIIMKFDIEDPWYPDDLENKLAASLNVDLDGDGQVSITEISTAYDNARFYVNLLNADELKYEVTCLNDEYSIFTEPTTEILISTGDPNANLSWSRTLIATLISILVICLILITFYKLTTLTIAVCTVGSVYTAIGLIIAIGAEFNIATLIGFILVAIASLASGMLYAHKLQEESYKGRSLKKANSEASKKSLLPIFDIHFALAMIGTFIYIFGGTMMRGFALSTILGAIFGFIINSLIFKILMWLPTNATGLIGRYELFGVSKDKVPAAGTEEKQSYFGSYAEKDTIKHRKPLGILALVLFVACLAGGITSACLNKGQVYTQNYVNNTTEIYFTTTNQDSYINTNNFIEDDLIANTYVYLNGNNKDALPLKDYLDKTVVYSHTDSEKDVDITYSITVAYFKTSINPNVDAYYKDDKLNTKSLDELYNEIILNKDASAMADVKQNVVYKTSQMNTGGIVLGTGIAIAVLAIYFMIRYRLSRGIAITLLALANSTIVAGFFALLSLTTLSISSYVTMAIPAVALFTYIVSIFFMSKERELINEDRSKLDTLDSRKEIMIKAGRSSCSIISVFSLVAVFMTIIYFGFGPGADALLFAAIALGMALSALFVVELAGPISHWLWGKLKERNINIKPRKVKKEKQHVTKKNSSEPEEAIFIGIND